MTGGGVSNCPSRRPPGNFREIAGLAEVLVDGCEADVGDMIERPEAVHHRLADFVRLDLVAAGFELALDRADQPVDALGRDVALAAGDGDRALELAAVERLALAILFDHGELAQLDPLERGEARAAGLALAAAADRGAVFATGGCP